MFVNIRSHTKNSHFCVFISCCCCPCFSSAKEISWCPTFLQQLVNQAHRLLWYKPPCSFCSGLTSMVSAPCYMRLPKFHPDIRFIFVMMQIIPNQLLPPRLTLNSPHRTIGVSCFPLVLCILQGATAEATIPVTYARLLLSTYSDFIAYWRSWDRGKQYVVFDIKTISYLQLASFKNKPSHEDTEVKLW